MTHISLDLENLKHITDTQELNAMQPEVDRMHQMLERGEGQGSDYLGWLHLPSGTTPDSIEVIQKAARNIQERCTALIVIGIGGSYLGAKAAVDFIGHTFSNQISGNGKTKIYFAGQNISSDYLSDLLDAIGDEDICLNVISKSGTTTEPAIAFRILKEYLEKKYGAEKARQRIWVTTDQAKGALKSLADAQGYPQFVIPDDVGGRYSVLTPVGLLPMAVAGIDIAAVIEGARKMEELCTVQANMGENPAYLYSVIRYLLYSKGFPLELMASFHPAFGTVMEWWKQLAGESEGKNLRGIFPASVQYTTDLHSLGQWVQEGNRIVFETFILLDTSSRQLEIPQFDNDDDGLNYLAGKSLDFVNDKAYKGTAMAHLEGGVPNLAIHLKERSAEALGQLFYFFERAVALTGYLCRVNPFDQPGVEFYKKNMFALLKKPGYGKGN